MPDEENDEEKEDIGNWWETSEKIEKNDEEEIIDINDK